MQKEDQPKSKFKITTLGAIAKKDKHAMVDGPFGSNLPASAYVSDGIPIIRGSNLSLGKERFNSDEYAFVSEETAQRLSRSFCYPNDIIFTKKGTLGQTGIVPEHSKYQKFLISSNQMKISVDSEVADPEFVYYYVSSPSSQKRIIQESSAAGVPKINLEYLRNFPIHLPPLPTQQRIVEILSNYDRLIDNNTRRIALLEESIHRLYQEWFVYLRFPGCDRVKVVDGVPEGWSRQTLNDICSNIRQGIHPSQTEPNTPYVGLEHIPRQSIALADWGFSRDVDSNKFKFAHRDILFGKIRPYFHKVVIAPMAGICSSDTIVMRPINEEFLGLLLSLTSNISFVDFASKTSKEGSKMPRADWQVMKQYPVLVPPQSTLNNFNGLVINAASQIENLVFTNQKLREARDLLLPRLMNGSLAV